ncbi:helix-turn-helix protein [Saccharopolyspora erythraea NRRL 2338]|uniref:HTH cro/C1-type domain-containing protein n=1 Tax=Saccharopolyspora erythraea TaxID=1836 RepID=A0ABP3PB92_SACER|nr:helix-turn-helix transcriptional regulator [Saccharopolyspora erythraea]PFG93848.1 helix-turn-helix protein [Saccharopolyspora erythraea NRRL 2338]
MAVDPRLEQRHPDIGRWSGRLQELAEATGLSLRQLSEHVPWSPSTLSRYLSGERVVDEAWLLASKLIDLAHRRGTPVDVRSDELHLLYQQARKAYQQQRRSARGKADQVGESAATAPTSSDVGLPERPAEQPVVASSGQPNATEPATDSSEQPNATPPAPSPDTPATATSEQSDAAPEPPSSPDARPARRSRRPFVLALATAVAVAAVAAAVWASLLWLRPQTVVWRANIVGTWSAQHQQHLGVFRFRTPDVPGDTDKATYHEGTAVSIVCQARHRRVVSDPTTGQSSPVWNRLSDGYWIPDLYTDLPKVTGEAPPLGIPLC